MPWYGWLILGLVVGCGIGIVIGGILAAAGYDSARYDGSGRGDLLP